MRRVRDKSLVPRTRDADVDLAVLGAESDANRYLVVVNRAAHARTVTVHVPMATKPAAVRDLLSGKATTWSADDGMVEARVELEPGWGRVLGLLATVPTELKVSVEPSPLGMPSVVRVQTEPGGGGLPVELKVTDAEGVVRHTCGGTRVLTGGRLAHSVRTAINDVPGPWRIQVRVPGVGLSHEVTAQLRAGARTR